MYIWSVDGSWTFIIPSFLQTEKNRREMRIKQKTAQLHELILQVDMLSLLTNVLIFTLFCVLQQIAFKSLVQRNRQREQMHGPPPPNSAIQLPFIIVNTSKKTVIDCSISNDKWVTIFVVCCFVVLYSQLLNESAGSRPTELAPGTWAFLICGTLCLAKAESQSNPIMNCSSIFIENRFQTIVNSRVSSVQPNEWQSSEECYRKCSVIVSSNSTIL